MTPIQEIISVLEGKKRMLLEALARADDGTNEPKGFQAQAGTREETQARGLAWIQGRANGILLPSLRPWFRRMRELGIIPPLWTGEPEDETKALEVLDGMISACQASLPGPPPPGKKTKKTKGKNIDERMLAAIRDDGERLYWSANRWKEFLDCAKSTVVETATWKNSCSPARERERLSKVDRLRRPR